MTKATEANKRRITLERTYRATIEDVWDLWTTPAGIESWWGPEGYTTKVLELELRAGGTQRYTMTATGTEQVAFMKRAGLPLTIESRITYTEVVPHERLAYEHMADFIPGVKPYGMATLVELHASADSVRMVMTFDAMHDETWTQRSIAGWESQLGKLTKLLTR